RRCAADPPGGRGLRGRQTRAIRDRAAEDPRGDGLDERGARTDHRTGASGPGQAPGGHPDHVVRAHARGPVRGRGGRRVMRSIDVRDLLRNPGSARTVRVHEAVPDLRTELAGVPEDEPIEGALTLESVVEGIYVTGSVTGRVSYRCA